MLNFSPLEANDDCQEQLSFRQPISFDQCAGWLHTPTGGAAANIAVVLCPGLRTDGMTGYRSFRRLATALADAGYPTLRYDYPGTGDSRDLGGPEHWAEWQQSVHYAANWLRDHCGARRVVLCGLRIGATLAAVVAGQRSDIAGLVLLAPVLRGRSFIRELKTEAAVRGDTPSVKEGLALDELSLTGETVKLLQQVDLRSIGLARDCRVAIFAQTVSPVLSDCVAAWTSGGADVVCEDFSGLEPMLRGAHLSHEPSAETQRIANWMLRKIPLGPLPRREARAAERVEIRTVSYRETPLRFGPNGKMFGILCRPATGFEEGFIVVIVNSGGNPHQGVARTNVDLARRFAAAGFASLRMDFAGLGDSIAPGDRETHVFETDRRADVATAIDELENLGYRRFAIQGLCSGAYHAFHAAAADPRLEVALLVNLPLLQWRNGDAVEFLSQIQEGPIKLALQLRQRDVWMRLLDQGLPGLRTRVVMQCAIIARKLSEAARRMLGLDAPATALQESLRRLSHQTRTLCLFSEGDLGVTAVERELGRNIPARNFEVSIVSRLDHALTKSDMRRVVTEHMVEFLTSGARSGMQAPTPELSASMKQSAVAGG